MSKTKIQFSTDRGKLATRSVDTKVDITMKYEAIVIWMSGDVNTIWVDEDEFDDLDYSQAVSRIWWKY